MHGIVVETGHVKFPAGSATVAVPTGLSNIFMGLGGPKTPEDGMSFIPVITCNNQVENDAVKFTRHGGYLKDSPTMNYVLMGW
jgi:hypothetical protein